MIKQWEEHQAAATASEEGEADNIRPTLTGMRDHAERVAAVARVAARAHRALITARQTLVRHHQADIAHVSRLDHEMAQQQSWDDDDDVRLMLDDGNDDNDRSDGEDSDDTIITYKHSIHISST